jgi:hypothetical protein
MDNQSNRTQTLISEGLLLAAIPVIAHSIAFLYELGYCQFFGIPTFLISISATAIFIAAGTMLSIAWPIYSIINLCSMLVDPLSTPLIRAVTRIFIVTVPLIALLFLFGLDWPELYTAALTVLFIVILEFGTPLLAQRGKGNFSEKLRYQEEFESQQKKSHLSNVFSRLGVSSAIVFVTLIYSLFIAYSCGRAAAKKQESFLVLKETSNVAVLRIYGDNLVGAAYDGKSKKLTGEFLLRKVGDASSDSLTLQKIGHLSAKTEF